MYGWARASCIQKGLISMTCLSACQQMTTSARDAASRIRRPGRGLGARVRPCRRETAGPAPAGRCCGPPNPAVRRRAGRYPAPHGHGFPGCAARCGWRPSSGNGWPPRHGRRPGRPAGPEWKRASRSGSRGSRPGCIRSAPTRRAGGRKAGQSVGCGAGFAFTGVVRLFMVTELHHYHESAAAAIRRPASARRGNTLCRT